MARLLVLLAILSACGTNNDGAGANQQAAFVFTDVYSTLESVQARALSAQPVAPVVQTVDYSGPCTMGGTIAMHGTYDGDGTTNATYMFDVSMAACAETGSTIDGSMTWDGVVSGTQANPVYSETLNGTISYIGSTYAGTFGYQDLTVTTTLVGTNVTVTVTGTFTIGGKTYTVDSGTWASFFGG